MNIYKDLKQFSHVKHFNLISATSNVYIQNIE